LRCDTALSVQARGAPRETSASGLPRRGEGVASHARDMAIDASTAAAAPATPSTAASGEGPLVQLESPSAAAENKAARKKIVKRRPEGSVGLRHAFQIAFLLLNVTIGVDFWLFVRHFESGGVLPATPRPPGVEGWLPIAALMNLKAWILTGELPTLFPAGVLLLATFLAIAFLFRKAFCSWLCPVGTLSEALWRLGRRLFGRTFALPKWADLPLRALKYLLLGFFLWFVAPMPVIAIRQFLQSPYGLVADVKMLDFFRDMGLTAAIVVVVLVALSVVVQNFWCRYLCPYGALLGAVSWLSPVRIRRDAAACTDCGKCAKVCPSRLPVDVKLSISSPECTGCVDCVAACPVSNALDMSVTRRARIPAWAFAGGIAAVFLGVVLAARVTGHWRTEVPSAIYRELIPRVEQIGH
jgi:polyferredoxin